MTLPSPIDPERLAALLDGRLNDSDAAAVRAQLGQADDETLAAFADASSIARELDASVEQAAALPANVIPFMRRRWTMVGAGVLAAAALIVAVVIVPQGRNPAEHYLVAELVSALPLNATANGSPPWSVTRGGSALSARAHAARTGVLLVHLALAESRGIADTAAASEIARTLSDLPGGSPVKIGFQDYARASRPSSSEGLSMLGQNALSIVDHTIAAASAYLESARLASTAGDVSFFAKHPASAALDELRASAALDPLERAQVTELAAMDPVGVASLPILRGRVETLLHALTR